jgi:3-hydroxyisobutyrate dehydrogenase-like beta-hydroxyacid dehydrogenase
MGRPMAANVLRAGLGLTVWNRTREKGRDLVASGATFADSPRAVAERADVVLTIVSDPPALEAVLFGPEGAIAGLRSGSVLVDSSTVSPALARKVAAACAVRGAGFLDAPVTGGTWGAEKGELVFMVGGDAAVLERATPVLYTMGTRFFHLGPVGAGQTVKLAMNLLLALEVDALAQAMALVRRAGGSAEKLVEVMQASMARAPVLDVKAKAILAKDDTPSFPLRLMHKDLALALDLAGELGLSLPSGAASRETYRAALEEAAGDVDYSAVARRYLK